MNSRPERREAGDTGLKRAQLVRQATFKRFDKNGDGKLSLEEP